MTLATKVNKNEPNEILSLKWIEMNRTSRKQKSGSGKGDNANNAGSRIHSGHYMTSSLYDQHEDTVEMPIASPDATNNDVTLNTELNADQEHYVYQEPEVVHQTKAPQKKSACTSVRKTAASGPLAKIQAVISSNGSISGGLTLDRNNKSLKNLMFYIKSAYSNNLTSPKWKNFKGLKLQVTEKIRLNNVIWRSWFEQFNIKGWLDDTFNVPTDTEFWLKKMRLVNLVTSFVVILFIQKIIVHTVKWRITFFTPTAGDVTSKAIRNLTMTVTLLYCHTGIFIIKIVVITENGHQLNLIEEKVESWTKKSCLEDLNYKTFLSQSHTFSIKKLYQFKKNYSIIFINDKKNAKKDQPNMKLRLICQFANGLDEKAPLQKMSKKEEKYWKARLESITNEYKKWREISRKQIKPTCEITEHFIPMKGSIQTGPSSSSTQQLSSSLSEAHYFEGSMTFQSNYQMQQNYAYPNNYSGLNEFGHSEFSVPVANDSHFNTYGANTPQNINSFSTYNLSSNYSGNNYSSSSVGGYSPSLPVASKQMQFNNRCRSPSPGLFDFDLNNFSSDTLFSTHLAEDHKDTIFGTNPDLFQPDLMHLFPNFDFFDLPGNNSDVFNLNADTSSEQNSPQSSNPQMASENIQPAQIQPFNHQTSDSAVDTDQVDKQSMSIAIDYSDLSNFDTLATVAAAQSITPGSISQPQNNRSMRQRHMSDMGDFNHLKVCFIFILALLPSS
ncbi:WBSCR14 -like protein [Brachionus plicatilis]|uniref:WBSCR14-like protein n=1 Tax=Brachionus plicatilis TaxID=10195 RepID=A0A3M7P960_BRAPC|nr:WBSCR14 -like protein [Brachionus plicatilis]